MLEDLGWSQDWELLGLGSIRGGELHRVRCMGKTSTAAQGCIFSTRTGCREVHPGEILLLCQPCPCSNIPAWNSPRKAELGQGKGKISAPTASQGRKAPFQGGVCAARGGESQRKSQEREEGSGPSVRRALVWRQVRELNHAVEELHGSHDVLILSGAGRKQTSWAQNSNLGSSPNLALLSWQFWPMGQEPQGLQAVSKLYWDPWLSSSV